MENNITQFFYNIVPGGLFIWALILIGPGVIDKTKVSENLGLNLVLFIIASLFIGFLFQAFTKIIKREFLYPKLFKNIEKDNKELFPIAESELKTMLQNKGDKLPDDPKALFYLMDNYLSAKNKQGYVNHFNSLHAFWANIMLGSIIISLALLYKIIFIPCFCSNESMTREIVAAVALLFIAVLARHMFIEFLKNSFDVVLKTFVVERQLRD